jgi:hypothetical protein
VPSKELAYTGTWQRWDVPNKVEWVDVVVDGAGSDTTPGGEVTGRINVKKVARLYILVGEKGALAGAPTVGGGGAAGGPGGWSGGGASVIRSSTTTGAVKAVAGGAGGASADGGKGGAGGGDVGQAGMFGTAGVGDVGAATGGTQAQGGNGGSSAAAAALAGSDASDDVLATGGRGGVPSRTGALAGGGGGGGYHPGGGGVAGWTGETPGGGGGGGSNYATALTSYSTTQAAGGTGHGRVTLTWVTPPPANQPPSPPTDVKLGPGKGTDYAEEMSTFSTGDLQVLATVKDSDSATVRLHLEYSPDASFSTVKTAESKFVAKNKQATINLTGLAQNTLWYGRLYAKDKQGLLSTNYTSLKFWTNRAPDPPTILTPGPNATLSDLDSALFAWNHTDPDHPDGGAHPSGFNLEWRRASTPLFQAGPWRSVTFLDTEAETYVGDPADFKASQTYEWHVRTRDEQQLWGPFSAIASFTVLGATAPAWLVSPINDEAVSAADDINLVWLFRDPVPGSAQATADLRYQLVGADDWVTVLGDSGVPGSVEGLLLPAGTLVPGRYRWQIRTTSDGTGLPGDWSDDGFFWVVGAPAVVTTAPVQPPRQIEARLGCGHHTVWVYRRGGQVPVGEIKPLTTLTWNRKRDDISTCVFTTNGFDYDCGSLLRDIHCWTHEVVIFRDGERVFEGPITLLTDTPTGFTVEASDVWRYVYRRILRQGYNDVFRVVNGVQVGMRSAVSRARQIAMNALAPDDPNVLNYLTSLDFPDDARESRAVPDFSSTAWEEIDSLAATGGIDYTSVGRRTIIWDTHRPLGRLPELRTEHFSDPPVISEYGMSLATDMAVTNNNGVYGLVSRRPEGEVGPYGIVEQLSSAYGESTDDTGAASDTLTEEALANLQQVLTDQAERNIAHRYPTPQIVRVPDNSSLDPETPVHINHLVPGVWVPLRANGVVRSIAQWQKLDLLTVTEDAQGEKVTVTFTPAPNAGEDPDATGDVTAEAVTA